MPRPSRVIDAHARIFVVLTAAEASALVTARPPQDPAGERGLAKIRTALEHTAEAPSPQPSAVPPLRAKAYRPRDHAPQFRQPAFRRRMAKATVSIDAAPAESRRADYVPWRDEAGGLWE